MLLKHTLFLSFVFLVIFYSSSRAEEVDIGARLELFVDDLLIERMTGGLSLKLHTPRPAEEVFVFDKPWEGSTGGYVSILRDGDLYRMYYRGAHAPTPETRGDYAVACYAESKDGIHWTRTNAGQSVTGLEGRQQLGPSVYFDGQKNFMAYNRRLQADNGGAF